MLIKTSIYSVHILLKAQDITQKHSAIIKLYFITKLLREDIN